MLAEKAPQHGREPDLQPLPYPVICVVLVMPELMRELLALHRESDRDDDVSESFGEWLVEAPTEEEGLHLARLHTGSVPAATRQWGAS